MDAEVHERIVDVRLIPKPEGHVIAFEAYRDLDTGQSFFLVNDHEPMNLRLEFERDYQGTYTWQTEQLSTGDWKIKITKLASTAAPQVLANTLELASQDTTQDVNGAIWKLEPNQRDLDANIIALAPQEEIGSHIGPDLDVLLHVFSGSGILNTETESLDLHSGDVVYLPARSRRHFISGPDGLRYFSVHQRKQTLGLMPRLLG